MSTEPILSPEEEEALAERFEIPWMEAWRYRDSEGEDAERKCNRLLAALKVLRDEMAANRRMRDEEVQRADKWLDRVNGTPKRSEAHLLLLIEAVAAYVPRYGKKSRDLPHGVIGWRSDPERLKVEDPEAALAWAKARGLEIKSQTVEGVPHKVLLEAWKAGKGIPAGCRVEEAEDVFYAKPSEVA